MTDEMAVRCAMCREMDRDCEHDALPFAYESAPTVNVTTRRCRRHQWDYDWVQPAELAGMRCVRCGVIRDEARARRGRSARRLGHDQERGFEREHGPTKIGERGDPVDHLGTFGKYQVKSTRAEVPVRLRHIDRMVGLYGDRVPILVERFVHVGRKTETYVTLRLRDWQAIHGRDEETP